MLDYIIGAIIILGVVIAIMSMVKAKKNGKQCSCGSCSCTCNNKDSCNK